MAENQTIIVGRRVTTDGWSSLLVGMRALSGYLFGLPTTGNFQHHRAVVVAPHRNPILARRHKAWAMHVRNGVGINEHKALPAIEMFASLNHRLHAQLCINGSTMAIS